MNQLREEYQNKIKKKLQDELKIENSLAVPNLEKIVLNVGMGEAITNSQALDTMADFLAEISGQKPIRTKANRAISNFKIRAGLEIGLKVTLRRDRMWDFFEKLIKIVLPRVKDFRGVSRRSFDGAGNYSLGIQDHTIFPEINTNKVDRIRSFQIVIVTSAKDNESATKLLEFLGMPFVKEEVEKMYNQMEKSIEKDRKARKKMKEERREEGKEAGEAEEE